MATRPASPGALVGAVEAKGFYYGTGLLPAFATFDAKGKEGNTDLGVHFGFAPASAVRWRATTTASVPVRGRPDRYASGVPDGRRRLGQILAGTELGVFQRQNILNDQTLFGVGGGGIAPRGTTLGRIGFGYIYPNFVRADHLLDAGLGKPLSLSRRLDRAQQLTASTPRLDHAATRGRGQLEEGQASTCSPAARSRTARTGRERQQRDSSRYRPAA